MVPTELVCERGSRSCELWVMVAARGTEVVARAGLSPKNRGVETVRHTALGRTVSAAAGVAAQQRGSAKAQRHVLTGGIHASIGCSCDERTDVGADIERRQHHTGTKPRRGKRGREQRRVWSGRVVQSHVVVGGAQARAARGAQAKPVYDNVEAGIRRGCD